MIWALSRRRETGVLHVAGGAQRCRVAVVDGRPCAATPLRADATLGDALLCEGALDPAAHRAALELAQPVGPVGDWLLSRRLVTPPALSHALRKQLRLRLLQLSDIEHVTLRFEPGDTAIGVALVREAAPAAEAVLGALRRSLRYRSGDALEALLPKGRLRLTPAGCALVEGAALWPAEAAMMSLLSVGVEARVLAGRTGDCERARRLLAGLHLIGAVERRAGSYALLARKRREVRRAAAPHALLDLPAHAGPAEARRALRRLALHLHPDRLDPDAPTGVRRASTEVMGALIAAEGRLRQSLPGA